MEQEAKLDRNQLYELVWSEPISRLAARFGYSDVGFSKLCRKLNIPLPQRGHWARIGAGQRILRPRLPPPDSVQSDFQIAPLSEEARENFLRKRSQGARMRQTVTASQPSPTANRLHPLARAARQRLDKKEGWSSHKGLRSAPMEALNIEVTGGSLDRAINLASVLLLSLEGLGTTVEIDPKKGRTLLNLCGAQIGFRISEFVARSTHENTPAEDRALKRYRDSFRFGMDAVPYPRIPQYDFTPTGLLTVTAFGWPERNWRDSTRTQLEQRLPEIVAGIIALAETVRDREAEYSRRELEHARRVDVYQTEMQRRQEERSAYAGLRADARAWERANQLRSYIQAQEDAARRDGRLTAEMVLWLEWAASKADWLDPTILVSDAILDAPEPEPPNYTYWR